MWFRKRGGKWHECRNPHSNTAVYHSCWNACGVSHWRHECETTHIPPPAEETCKRCRKAAEKG
jgi:hypothetical protein